MAKDKTFRASFLRRLATEKVWVPREDRPPQHQTGKRFFCRGGFFWGTFFSVFCSYGIDRRVL